MGGASSRSVLHFSYNKELKQGRSMRLNEGDLL